jgi:hypothetical protein
VAVAIPLRSSGEGFIEGKAERDLLMGIDKPSIRKNNWNT